MASAAPTPEQTAIAARHAARSLQAQPTDTRVRILRALAAGLRAKEADILAANQKDLEAAQKGAIDRSLLSRLALSPAKLATLAKGIEQIAAQPDPIGRVLRATELSPGLELQQQTVPLGVLLVIFESRPDALPQIAALAIASGNGLILKGGKEAAHSNACLHAVVAAAITEATQGAVSPALVSLVTSRADISALVAVDSVIDLVIPRGSSELVRHIQQNTRIPVMGHSEGVCHVFVDAAAELSKAVRVAVDSKTDYPAACNAAETLLIHKAWLAPQEATGSSGVHTLVDALRSAGVTLYAGPAMLTELASAATSPTGSSSSSSSSGASSSQWWADAATDLHHEYGDLKMTVELVPSLDAAIEHIHRFGSGHTESIVTEDAAAAHAFLSRVDSACVFHNASTRFADGFRFGLGAEVGISTSRLHARGPVGVDGLCSTKWKLVGAGDKAFAVGDFAAAGTRHYTHVSHPVGPDTQPF